MSMIFPSTPGSKQTLAALFLADSAGLFATAPAIFHASTGSGRALVFGLSAQSLFLVAGTLGLGIAFLLLGLLTMSENRLVLKVASQVTHHNITPWILGPLAISGWLLAWTPAEAFGNAYYYALRLLPLAAWLAFACGNGFLYSLAIQKKATWANLRSYFVHNKALFITAAIAALIALVFVWLVNNRILDVTASEEDYWYGAGVPVLAWQVLAASLVGLLMGWVEKRFVTNEGKTKARLDGLVFVAIWLIAAFLWVKEPIRTNFMLTDPFPPNFEYYPGADGEFYDLNSQYALIGQKLFNGYSYDRPLYTAFLFYLHQLVGQGYENVANLQAVLLALFPACAYLLGKELLGRGAGASLGLLLLLRGVNGLAAGSWLENANQKMYLTDYPTALLLIVIIYLAIRWAKNPRQNWVLAGWVAGLIGFTGMLRPHALILLPAAGFLALWFYLRPGKLLFSMASFMLAAYLATVTPWVQFNGSGVSLFDLYFSRIFIVIQERYPDFRWPWENGMLPSPQLASLNLPFTDMPKATADFILDHFLNNLTTATLTLPSTLQNIGLSSVIKETEPFWQPYWNGEMSYQAQWLILFNIVLITLGIGAAWKQHRLSGLLPLGAMCLYFLVNGLGRTSGGRYIVPVDWILIAYYVFGLWTLLHIMSTWLGINLATTSAQNSPKKTTVWHGLGSLVALFALGALIPLANVFEKPRFEALEKSQIAAIVETQYGKALGLQPGVLSNFLAQNDSVILQGRALYPRFAGRGTNPMIAGPLFTPKLYSRMSFTVIGPQGEQAIILPTTSDWFPLPNTADVFVLGCRTEYFTQAWAVIVPQQDGIYLQTPAVPLSCPLPEPRCDNNGNCE